SDSNFVTMFLCQYDTQSGKLTYVNAGHPRPYWFTPSSSVDPFGELTGPILGVGASNPSWNFEQREQHLEAGQTLLLYTDGITEARAPDGQMLRAAGMEQLLARVQNQSVETICAVLMEDVNRFQNGQPTDDITLVALRRQT